MNRIAPFLLLLLLLVSSEILCAQNFDRIYQSPCYSAQGIQASGDGNFYVVAQDYNLDILVSKINAFGIPQWTKSIGDPFKREHPADILVTDNHQIIISANSDNGGFSNYGQALIIGLDSSGTVLFNRTLGDTINQALTAFSITPEPQNGFTISYDYYDGGSSYVGLLLAQFDSAGICLRQITIDNGATGVEKIIRRKDGGYLLCNYLMLSLLVLDSNWTNASFMKFSSFNYTDYRVNCIKQVSDSDYYIAGSTDFQGMFGHIHATASGDYLLDVLNVYPYNTDLTFADILPLNDGTFFLIGSAIITNLPISNSNNIIIHANNLLQPLKSVIIQNANSTDPFINISTSSLNGQNIIFSSSRYDSLGFYPEYFEIVSMDTSFNEICNLRDTILTPIVDMPYQDFSLLPVITPASLITDSVYLSVTSQVLTNFSCKDSTVNIEPINQKSFYIFPNPVTDLLTIQTEDVIQYNLSVTIYDLTGKVEKKVVGVIDGQLLKIDIHELPPGIHCLVLEGFKTMRYNKL